MTRKTALVTGGTSGVGLSLVRALARQGAEVHFIGTHEERGRAVEAELEGAAGGRGRFIALDLSSLRAVRAFTVDFAAEVEHLDVLANVAGVVLPHRQETAEGLEKTFAVNYLSAFVLSRELTPLLSAASRGRIVNVSGSRGLVLPESLDFDDLGFAKSYSGPRAAIRAMHAKAVMTQSLAERLREHAIDVNAFHPGAVKSGLGRSMPFPLRTLMSAGSALLPSTSKSGVYTATAEELVGVTGQYFVGKKALALTFDAAYKERLWQETEALVEAALAVP